MERDRAAEGPREIRLEGAPLLFLGGAALALLVGAFYVGRWVERAEAPPAPGNGASRTAGGEPLDSASDDVNFFDTLGGGEKASEPRREAVKSAPSPAEEQPAAPLPGSGPWVVQVFAGRDKATADLLVRTLREKGHPVRLDARREGSGSLYRVQVGGYPSRETAEGTAERLKKDGMSGAWVTRTR
jgi:hypothetical protein